MKNKKLTIRVTDFERRPLEQEANRRGMTQSELIRSLIARFPERAPRRLCRIQEILSAIHPTLMLRMFVVGLLAEEAKASHKVHGQFVFST
ncbi:CopG family transcriptional regulator [Moorena sp. SIOASIH]|uniref:ribbon-helix-helix domain-containing protein n=1 Tax=Moorena sp. SIOASIH TaxID=2607817 RepID=UPI0025CBF7B6|nr:CopG family transcriptional regulator [Moorena sp. SIOASIH]